MDRVYTHEGLTVTLDTDCVIVYLEDTQVIECTRDEFKAMARAVLAIMEEVE